MAIQKVIISVNDVGTRLLNWLKRHYQGMPFNHLQKWLRTGQIRLDGKRVKGNEVLSLNQELRLPSYMPVVGNVQSSIKKPPKQELLKQIRDAIVYQNDHWIVLNKPQGLATQGGTGIKESVDQIMAALFTPAPKLTHRLDKDTSGVLLLAKTLEDARWLTQMFKEGTVAKTYIAFVVGVPKENAGTVDLPICKLPGKIGERMVVDFNEGLEAITHYRVLETKNNLSLLELKPMTGRMHQLRLHCAELGTPILGDGKYGGKSAHPEGVRFTLHLHAHQIEFMDAKGKSQTFKVELPDHMVITLKKFKFILPSF
ncbi:hypothetical protein IM40_08715 [Candidatus Paracaedimonas acanthamoebae]|nr:hypothetical protein IM40_08715 [Candidatus Paracaedimonas acanthamoebae]